ncbi:hypothetical protein AAVH_37003 [Aphelenchoides avenae]|nr:hypothetical protein AAVH_37003 [Aphelenchus avenae]
MSRKTVSLNKQLNSMLLVQALSPFAVIVIPLFMTCAVIYNGTKNADSLAYVNTALSWIPVTGPISTMYFVKEYRNTILTALRLRKTRTSNDSDGTSNSQTAAQQTAPRISTVPC